jgi:hypothetical protein
MLIEAKTAMMANVTATSNAVKPELFPFDMTHLTRRPESYKSYAIDIRTSNGPDVKNIFNILI